MENLLFNLKTVERFSSKIKLNNKQKVAAKSWLYLLEQGKLKKEKLNYIKFVEYILKDLLGYDVKKDMDFEAGNIEFSFKNKQEKTILGIEAKGTKTKDLFAEQKGYRKGQKTPIIQLWTYMGKLNLDYGIATNYKYFVLIDKTKGSSTYHFFDFEEVKNNDDKLKEFIAIFSKEQIIDNNFVEKLKKESDIEEKNFTKEFYKLFHETRLMLLKEFQEGGISKEDSIHYAQVYLNRLMFVFFAEDTDKLEKRLFENLIIKVLDSGMPITEHSHFISEAIRGLFRSLDRGSKTPTKIFGFNGGLFCEEISPNIYFKDLRDKKFYTEIYQHSKLKKEPELDSISKKIFLKYKNRLNPIIKNLLVMASFDFKTEVSVNILGHIFEQSLSDLEELKEGKATKRKKEGIYYTPEYITDYICRNTIIPYLSKGKASTPRELVLEYQKKIKELEVKFASIKILDPACGSGAFLIKAVDILLEIHKEIQLFKQDKGEYTAIKKGRKKKKEDGQLMLIKWNEEDEAREIIEKNIFGVDLNEESIEITKLSLFLKIAKKNKKLIDLSKNIKCGNSLIDNPDVDPKAFNWEKEFPFKFDIVIGNPPYVKARDYENIRIRKYLDNKYETAYKMWDLYIPFIEKGINLMKEKGNFSMIIPDTIGKAEYTSKLVDWIESNYCLYQIDFFPETYVFENVGVKSKIIFIKKQKTFKNATRIAHILDITNIKKLDAVKGKEKYLYEKSGINLEFRNCLSLDNICLVSYGLRLNSDKHDKKGKFKKEDLLSEKRTKINNKLYTEGKFLERYAITKKLFVEWGTERSPNRLVRPTFPELYPPKKLLMSRQKRIATLSAEGEICDNTLIMGILVKDLKGVENKSISKYFKNIGKNRKDIEETSKNYDLPYLLSLINSKLMYYFIKYNSKGAIDTYPDDWKKIPIRKVSTKEQKPFIKKANLMLRLNKEFYEKKSKFLKLIKHEYKIEKITKNMDKFYKSDFDDFMKQLKVNLKINKKSELLDFFEKNKKELLKLKDEIDKTDNEINHMVYNLYGLTNKEINIVEAN